MADGARPAFKPQRARASLGALPSTSHARLSHINKENPSTSRLDSTTPAPGSDAPAPPPSTATGRSKKRAQSLGGDALEVARKRLQLGEPPRLEMSPGKLERRQRAPRRSILKQTPAKFDEINHTFSFSTSASGRINDWEKAHAQTTDLSALSAFTSAAAPSSSGPAQTSTQRRRSSLKPRVSAASGNYDDSDSRGSDMDEEDEVTDDDDDPNGSLDMDVTRFENDTALYDFDGRRKSVAHSRRVSFAPSAAIRTFTPDKPTAEAQAYEAERRRLEAEAAEAASAAGETSLATYSSDDDDHLAADNADDDTGAYESEPSMEIAGDEVTLAFRGHFAGTQIPASALQEDDDEHSDEGSSLERSVDDDADGTMAMDEVTGGVTSAFPAHFAPAAVSSSQEAGEGGFDASAVHARAQAETTPAFPLFGARTPSAGSSSSSSAAITAAGIAQAYKRAGPRPSELARQEDEDDEAVMRELGFARGGRPRKSRAASTIVEEDEDDEDSDGEVDMEDATGAMDMTTAIGGIVQASSSQERAAEMDEDEDEEMDSDAEVSFQLISGERTVDMTFATDGEGADKDDEPVEQEQDAATTEGALPARPQPAAPAPTFSFATTFTSSTIRQSLGPSLTAPSHPFERAGSAPPFQAQSPHKSAADRAAAYVSPVRPTASSSSSIGAARPGLTRALSVPLEAAGGARTPTRSPFLGGRGSGRFSTSPAPPGGARSSPFRSPRRVPFDSPRAGTSSLPAAMLGAPPKSPGRARREPSPAKDASASATAEVEKAGATPAAATAPLNGLDLKEQQPPASPGITMRSRSRSRSRSMSPVKQAQAPTTPGRVVFQPRSVAPPLSVGRSPGGSLSLRALLGKGGAKDEAGGVGDKRVAELKGGADGDELNLTGTSFDGSFSHDNDSPALPASLDAFFTATGTSFVNDVVALVDVEKSAANRRKSMAAPSTDARGPSGPPTYADLAVVGACKSLIHRLYTNDSHILSEQIDELQHMVRQQEEAIRQGQVPPIFRTWTTASEEVKNVIKTQLGQIKLHYLLASQLEFTSARSTNFGQIVDAMEQSFVDIKHDRALLARSKVATVIPDLEARHIALHAELEAERQLDAQLSAMAPEDVEFRESLLADSEEQEEQLNGNAAKGIPGQRPELDRIKQHLISYEDTFDKYSTEEARLADEISMLEELRRDKRSKADLVRLRAEFDALQHLQGWTLVRFDPTEVEMRCGDDFVVRLGFEKEGTLAVIEAPCEMVPLPMKMAGSLSAQVTMALLAFVNEDLEHKLAKRSIDARVLLRYIGARATMMRHVRQEIVLASLRYPTTLALANPSVPSSTPTLHLDVFCATSRRGFVVAVPLSGDMLVEAHEPEKWAAESASAAVDARFGFVKGGSVNALALAQTINDRLSAGYGRSALLDAVAAAEEEADRA